MTRKPFVTLVKPDRSVAEKNVMNQLALAKRDEKPRTIHRYDDARTDMPPIAFAEHILNGEGLLTTRNGIEFLNGKPAQPYLKMQAANRVLKRLGLQQITGSREWVE